MVSEILLANRDQEENLRTFQRNHFGGGDFLIRVEREPSYFNSLYSEGNQTDVIIARDKITKEIYATGTMSEKMCFLNGEKSSSWIGYLSGLQITPKKRNSTLLARGYKFFSKLRSDKKSKLFLSVIVENNHKAMKTLTSKRAGLPKYNDWGLIDILIMKNRDIYPKNYKMDPTLPANFKVLRAETSDLNAIVKFWNEEGKKYQFFPAYTVDDILKEGGLLQGLKSRDIRIIVDHTGEIYGTLSLWNQTSFRQRYVHQYPKIIKYLKPLLNTFCYFKKLPKFPAVKNPVNYSYISNLCIKKDEPLFAKALIHSVLKDHSKGSNDDYLALGVHRSDPLLKVFNEIPHKHFLNRLFVVNWEEEQARHDSLNKNLVPYIELGSL